VASTSGRIGGVSGEPLHARVRDLWVSPAGVAISFLTTPGVADADADADTDSDESGIAEITSEAFVIHHRGRVVRRGLSSTRRLLGSQPRRAGDQPFAAP
jgi:hypothetical protein